MIRETTTADPNSGSDRPTEQQPGPWRKELDDYVRAFSGAFLFGTPLLFTMEMWWIGEVADISRLIGFMLVGLLVNIVLAQASGFKRETTFSTNADQAVDTLAVGVVASFVVLLVLNRIQMSDPIDTIAGKIILQAVPLSIGAAAANAVFSRRKGRQGDDSQQSDYEGNPWRDTLGDLGATVGGGIFLGFSIAPTEEVPMLAAEIGAAHEFALVALALVLSYGIVFAAGFSPQRPHQRVKGPFQRPLPETTLAYLVSLVVALVSLYFFHQIDIGDPPDYVLSQVLVLGFPTAMGGAAGRLVI